MNLLFLGALAVLVVVVLRFFCGPLFRKLRLFYHLRAIPPPIPPHWLLGHLPDLLTPGRDEELTNQFGERGMKISRLNELIVQEIVLNHPEPASLLLKTAEPKAETIYGFLREWLGDGLLISTGKRWARDRRLLTRGFHFDILRGYLPVYKESVGAVLDQWAEVSRQDNGQKVNVSTASKQITLESILRCIMSYNPHNQSEEANRQMERYVKAVDEISRLMLQRAFNPLLHSNFIFALSSTGRKFYKERAVCHSISQSLIEERRRSLAKMKEEQGLDSQEEEIVALKKQSATGSLDFLDILLTVRDEDGEGLSDKEIQEQVDTFLFEGHDTTASGLQWTLFFLAKHPDLQEKCRQEVRSCLDDNQEFTYESLSKLLYLTQFIKESTRLKPPVPYISRNLTQPMTVEGYFLPKGSMVTASILGCNRHPDAWERPLEFDPDRFSPKNSAKRHPYAFIPFSAGPRNCIGQTLAMDELKTVISLILLRFRLTWDPEVPDPKIHAFLISRPSQEIEIYAHEI